MHDKVCNERLQWTHENSWNVHLNCIWWLNMELHRQQARNSVRSLFLNMLKYVSIHIFLLSIQFLYSFFIFFLLFLFFCCFVSFKFIFEKSIYNIFFLPQSSNRLNVKCYVVWFNAISFQIHKIDYFLSLQINNLYDLIWNVTTLSIIIVLSTTSWLFAFFFEL